MSAPHRNAYRPTVMGRRAVVTSAHPLASMAGIQMLLEGGNAVDAAVAVASTLNVVEPYMSGIGGVGAMLISSANGRERHVLNFVGRVPAAADPERATSAELEDGPRASLVPGNPGGWLAAHERFGTLPRSAVFAPAIRMAEDGVPLTWKNCEFFNRARNKLAISGEAQRIYLSAGEPRPGAPLVNNDLAATYRQVADGGADAFYRGPVAQAICRAIREAGGWLTEDDLAGFQPEWLAPLTLPFRDTEVITMPPPFSAFQALQTLSILEDDDLPAWGHNSAEYLHHFIEAVKLATADRLAYAYGAQVPIDGLMAKPYGRAQRARIDRTRAGVSEGERFALERLPEQIEAGHLEEFTAVFAREQTTHFACADAGGIVVTCTQTLGAPFGSGFAIPGTGIVLNNLLQWQDLHPDSPNRLRPGRRVGTNMTPMQVFADGEFRMSIGTPGSYGILQTTVQMLLNVLAFEMHMQEAIEAPRVRVYRDRLVDAEGRIGGSVRDELARRGHQVNAIEDWSWIVGGGQGITRDLESGALQGGADPRRDGYALAV